MKPGSTALLQQASRGWPDGEGLISQPCGAFRIAQTHQAGSNTWTTPDSAIASATPWKICVTHYGRGHQKRASDWLAGFA